MLELLNNQLNLRIKKDVINIDKIINKAYKIYTYKT